MTDLQEQENEQQDKPMQNDTKRRDWVVVENNPKRTEQEFYDYLISLTNIKYFCFGKEQGEQGTIHYQCYLEFSESIRFSKMKKDLPTAHLEPRHGKKIECRDYVHKIGKYADKEHTKIGDKIWEFGTFVDDGERSDLNDMMDDIENGMSNIELSRKYQGKYATHQKWANQYRQDFLYDKYGKIWRDELKIIYISGKTGVGKTRYVVKNHGYENIYFVSDYEKHPFDNYNGQPVIVFEEFRSQIQFTQMLRYLDKHPVILPARFQNKQACYLYAYIISNWSLYQQYKNIQKDYPDDWQAFLRRIDEVYDFNKSITDHIPKELGQILTQKEVDELGF